MTSGWQKRETYTFPETNRKEKNKEPRRKKKDLSADGIRNRVKYMFQRSKHEMGANSTVGAGESCLWVGGVVLCRQSVRPPALQKKTVQKKESSEGRGSRTRKGGHDLPYSGREVIRRRCKTS